MNDIDNIEDGSTITNITSSDPFNLHNFQTSIFETPPSLLASPHFSSNIFSTPTPRTRVTCPLCRQETHALKPPALASCTHRFCTSCVEVMTDHGCLMCTQDQNERSLAVLRAQSSHDAARNLEALMDGFSIWGSNTSSAIWDSNKSFQSITGFESTRSVDGGSDSAMFSPPRLSCGTCGEDVRATHLCHNCHDLLCSGCVDAHLRVRVTRDHRVVPVSASAADSWPFSGRSSDDVLAVSSCRVHEGRFVSVCETCSRVALCCRCLPDHTGHQLTPFGDLKTVFSNLVAESKEDEKTVDEAMESVRTMSERVDSSVQAVCAELRSVMNMHISALEERKRELLQRVDTIRMSKMGILKQQNDNLTLKKNRIALMNQTIEGVKESEDQEQLANAFDALVKLLCEPRLPPFAHESDTIKFVHPDQQLLLKIRTMGSLESGACAVTSQLVGESFRRAIRERQSVLHIQLRDACGEICRSRGQQVAACLVAPNSQLVDLHLTEREGGICTLTFIPTQDGPHTLSVTVRGVPIMGCPVQIEVRRGRNYEEMGSQGELFSFGREGSADGELCRPWGICCDLLGRILVADRSNNRIQIFDKDGHFLFKFGSSGTRPAQFDRPAGITTNTLNQVVVADKDNHRIQVFDEKGNFILKFGERGRQIGSFNYPWGVATNSQNHIAVSDTRNHRVQVFTSMGQFIRKCGFDSSFFYKHLDSPRGLCYLPDGQLLITDFNNHRLAILSASRSSPDMKCYGSEGDSQGLFCRPQGVATDPEGHILVCDSRNNRVQIFNMDDMRCVATFGGACKCPNGFQMPAELPAPVALSPSAPPLFGYPSSRSTLDRPTDLCVSPDGRIYVVDFGNNCIRVY